MAKNMTKNVNKYFFIFKFCYIFLDERADPKYHDYTWNWWIADNGEYAKKEL
jgi:hypothetical protein